MDRARGAQGGATPRPDHNAAQACRLANRLHEMELCDVGDESKGPDEGQKVRGLRDARDQARLQSEMLVRRIQARLVMEEQRSAAFDDLFDEILSWTALSSIDKGECSDFRGVNTACNAMRSIVINIIGPNYTLHTTFWSVTLNHNLFAGSLGIPTAVSRRW